MHGIQSRFVTNPFLDRPATEAVATNALAFAIHNTFAASPARGARQADDQGAAGVGCVSLSALRNAATPA